MILNVPHKCELFVSSEQWNESLSFLMYITLLCINVYEMHFKSNIAVQNTGNFSHLESLQKHTFNLFALCLLSRHCFVFCSFCFSPSLLPVPPFLSSSVFTPSCHCWRRPAGSVSSRGPATARVTPPLTAKEVKLWCHSRRADKTTPWGCGGPDRSALPQRATRSRMQLWWRPEALLIKLYQIELHLPCDIYFRNVWCG